MNRKNKTNKKRGRSKKLGRPRKNKLTRTEKRKIKEGLEGITNVVAMIHRIRLSSPTAFALRGLPDYTHRWFNSQFRYMLGDKFIQIAPERKFDPDKRTDIYKLTFEVSSDNNYFHRL